MQSVMPYIESVARKNVLQTWSKILEHNVVNYYCGYSL